MLLDKRVCPFYDMCNFLFISTLMEAGWSEWASVVPDSSE